MRKKANPLIIGIVLCSAFVAIFFTFHSCKREQSSAEKSTSPRISAADNEPTWSPDGSKIIFDTNRHGNWEIYTIDVDGSDETRLTYERGGMPHFSPDGTKIVFLSSREGNREIYSMNADGTNQTRLTKNTANDERPTWSPDGKKIVFHSVRDGNWEIYVMNADGSNQTRLTDNPAVDRKPTWSPDGEKIAFHSHRDKQKDRNVEIYVMNADGSNQTRLTDNPARDAMPCWSPDGTHILFESDRDGNFELYAMNADGSDPIRLTDNPAYDGAASWSPDGQKIAFVTDRDFDEEIYVMNADGSNPVNLTKNAPANAASGLVPVQQSELDLDEIPYKIVFESARKIDGKMSWDICLIHADGSGLVNLTKTPEIQEMYPKASPDGSLICFVTDEGKDRKNKRRNVYYMNIDGTNRVKVAENAYQPCWSADGRYIAYLPGEFPRYNRNMWANKGLEIFDIETKEVKKHPNEKISHLFNLCWSPDGEWFTAAGIGGPNIAFRADDNTKMNLLAQGCRPEISPDGKRIAWHGTDWNINVGRIDFKSSQSNVFDHTIVAMCDREHEIYHVDWSPDGNYLTFSYWPYGGNEDVGSPAPGANICICDLKTGKWTQITTDGQHNKEPDWVPVQGGK